MTNIVKNSLGFDSDLFVYQDKAMFNYSVDTILLGNFATINSTTRHVLEIGTNNGALALFLSARKMDLKIDALEINTKACALAQKNIALNQKKAQIRVINEDFNIFYPKHNQEQRRKYDSIICNPPFYKPTSTHRRKGNEALFVATHEVMINLEQIILGASKIIKQKGYLAIVEPTERLVDLLILMRKYGFEPKRIQMIHPRIKQKSNLVLVEGRFQAGWGTHFLPNIYLHPETKSDHVYLPEVKKLYKPIKYKRKV